MFQDIGPIFSAYYYSSKSKARKTKQKTMIIEFCGDHYLMSLMRTFTLKQQRDSSYTRIGSARESPMASSLNRDWTPRSHYRPSGSKSYYPSDPMDQGGGQHYHVGSSMEASRTTTSSRDEASVSISNASDLETEWVEEDDPGVYITIRQLADGTRELRRVRFR